jgi:hypothetical protein
VRQRCTHDYVRHGTTTLFAALNIATGKVTSTCRPRHRVRDLTRKIRDKPQTRTTRISSFSSPVLIGAPGLSSYSSVIRPGADCVLDQIRDPEVIVLDGAELARLRLEIGLGDEV